MSWKRWIIVDLYTQGVVPLTPPVFSMLRLHSQREDVARVQ